MDRFLEYKNNGVTLYPNLICSGELKSAISDIEKIISDYANELDCSEECYLSSVSRWASPSLMTDRFLALIYQQVQPSLKRFFKTSVELTKLNVICKNQYAPYSIPCHQDIAYQQQAYYDVSCWLPLSDIQLEDGPLVCLPGSHQAVIEPAVDFWDINFLDKKVQSDEWVKKAVYFSMSSGDAVIFNSRVWHGSPPNLGGRSRYVLVSRWKLSNNLDVPEVPEKIPGKFGMWNSHAKTVALLNALLRAYQIDAPSDFIDLLRRVLGLLPKLEWIKNVSETKRAIQLVQILHLASQKHSGGDSQGYIYKNLWFCFLNQIQDYLQSNTKVTHEYI